MLSKHLSAIATFVCVHELKYDIHSRCSTCINSLGPQQPADLMLIAPAAALPKRSSLNDTKPDAHLSLAADKEAWAKSDKNRQ